MYPSRVHLFLINFPAEEFISNIPSFKRYICQNVALNFFASLAKVSGLAGGKNKLSHRATIYCS